MFCSSHQALSSSIKRMQMNTYLRHWGRVTQICVFTLQLHKTTQIRVFNTCLFSLHNTLNYAKHGACLRMVLTDVYRNLTSLWIKPRERAFKQFKNPVLNVLRGVPIYGKLFMLSFYMHWMKTGGSYKLKKICHCVFNQTLTLVTRKANARHNLGTLHETRVMLQKLWITSLT